MRRSIPRASRERQLSGAGGLLCEPSRLGGGFFIGDEQIVPVENFVEGAGVEVGEAAPAGAN